MKNKGIIFTIDGIIALTFIALFSMILFVPTYDNTKEIEKILINNRISDLLITAQLLEIENSNILEQKFQLLLEDKSGFIIINNKKIEINNSHEKTRLISQNIRYINSSNKEIYIEIGVYY